MSNHGRENNVGIGTTNPTANLQVNGTVKMLGTRITGLAINTTYLAASDGFFSASCTAAASSTATVTFATDSSNPPTTVFAISACTSDGFGNPESVCSVNFTIKKGEYYKLSSVGFVNCTYASFTPLGI